MITVAGVDVSRIRLFPVNPKCTLLIKNAKILRIFFASAKIVIHCFLKKTPRKITNLNSGHPNIGHIRIADT